MRRRGRKKSQKLLCRIVQAKDYALLLGLPGTGKTSTIAVAVMLLLAMGKSVLLTSYTNSAVDNVMLKLAACGAKMLRLGRTESMHPEMRPYALGGPNMDMRFWPRFTSVFILVSILLPTLCLLSSWAADDPPGADELIVSMSLLCWAVQ